MAETESRETLNPQLIINYENPEQGGKRLYDPNRVSDDGYIYTPYITIKGKKIYHPSGGVFKFQP